MPYKSIKLPEYPCHTDMWDILARENRPITVYGMGNGADKLFRKFEEYGITVSDIFASDGFVRGHSYRGMRVKSFSEIRDTYSDFVIVVSFASNRSEVIEMIKALDEKYELYLPDMPVADESEYFDKKFFNENYEKIIAAEALFSDEDSKNCFRSVISYKLSGKISYLLDAYSTKDGLYSVLDCENIRSAIDAGAYNGDTVREMKSYFPNLSGIVAIEPDKKNFKRLLKYAESTDGLRPTVVNAAVHSEMGIAEFSRSGNRNSTLAATASYEHSVDTVSVITVDSLSANADYIKYDVEGAERDALLGSVETVRKCGSRLLVSAYHRSRDIFELPLLLHELFPQKRLVLRRELSLPAWEIDLIAL